jgi:Aspartyl aminopeptidase
MTREELFYETKNVYEKADEARVKAIYDFAEGYKTYLSASRTERLAVREAVKLAEAKGFRAWEPGDPVKPGDKIYMVNRGKAMTLAVIGKKSLNEGIRLAAAHVDNPRLDLKQHPLYEDSEMAFFKTHYYGGIKKFYWVATPLAIVGTIVRKDGTVLDVSLGLEPGEPRFVITDLLIHLAGDQMKKTAADFIPGESLNILLGTRPDGEEGSDRVKLAVMKLLNEKYGIIEADLLSSELCVVPADEVVDLGLDRSLVGGFGHDDRVCAYAELMAILETEAPERTAVCLFADKEEVGSVGVTGMNSQNFEYFMEGLCKALGADLRRCFNRSLCLSADVCNAFDPNFPETADRRNNAKLNHGVGIIKFTGSRGKSGSNDAPAELVGRVRRMLDEADVVWQMGELGKVDQGGGGTVASITAMRDIDTIDAGVPVLNMHAPFEVIAKADLYMTYRAMYTLFNTVC